MLNIQNITPKLFAVDALRLVQVHHKKLADIVSI